ncbi:MAG TPA: ATP-binding cassette domain-containing protein [Chlamydiales bacterium]|nr:ATP-binding cassette domain-containing protein [Chlamydiales bacterium]
MHSNVSFTYPKSDQPALKDLSFSINAGQVVVIVGSNGSGKSTLLKLLNRLFDPTSGIIELDGKPLTSYKADDVRRAMAILYQTYTHYPLSIKENILLGQPDLAVSQSCGGDTGKTYEGAMEEAAKQGGSFEFVKDKAKGFDTVLNPKVNASSGFNPNPSPAFVAKKNEVSKVTEVSAGLWQRLALWVVFSNVYPSCRWLWLTGH